MVKLFRADLTPTGRPVLLPGEVERGMLDKVRSGRLQAASAPALWALSACFPCFPLAGSARCCPRFRAD
jgi:hypothetical protein